MYKLLLGLGLIAVLVVPLTAKAKVGVGMGSGKIEVTENLRPGMIYELPPLDVVNTGDEAAGYEVSVAYHQDQKELKPNQEWFSFEPQKFTLAPGEVKNVKVTVNLPIKMEPGEYFAYLEAHPDKVLDTKGTSIGIAAAAKLYFKVVPANFFQGIFYKAASFWRVHEPWSQRVAIAVGAVLGWWILQKYFHLEVGLKKKDTKTNE